MTIKVDPARFGVELHGANPNPDEAAHRKMIETLVARGLRAQLRTGSFISGAQYVALDFFKDAPPVTLDWSHTPVEIATLPGTMESIADNLAGVVKKLDQLPLKEIADDLHKTITGVDKTLVSAQTTFTNVDKLLVTADKLIAPDSNLDQQISSLLQEMGGAARAMRLLTDYLERHPEALVRGKVGSAKE